MCLTTLCLKRIFSRMRARRRSRYRYLSRSNSSTGRARSISNGGGSEDLPALGVKRDLRDPTTVAQVDEDQPAVIPPAVHPAREPHRLADVLLAQLSSRAGPVWVSG